MRRSAPLLLVLAACGGPDELPPEVFSGGDATVFDDTRDAYSHVLPAIGRDGERKFFRGRALFRDGWVTAPSSTDTRDGLGPVFNARSCIACHERDGRGRPPGSGEEMLSMLVRLSIPGQQPEPTYGGQLQPQAVLGVPYEGRPTVTYEENDGLRHPIYGFEDLSFGAFHPDTQFSFRVAPSVYGLGLLEAIPAETIEALADPEDADGDGISGRTNRVLDVSTGRMVLGRFGWKANQPSLRQQAAGAFNGDIGITSSLFPAEDCPSAQTECANAPRGGAPELEDVILDSVAFYTQTIAVPARRDPELHQDGAELFERIGCADCHVPALETGAFDDVPELSGQTIRPYTDLLLHDMGPELADGRPDFDADGQEWRTPPLWGIGLLETVNGHGFLLHDGPRTKPRRGDPLARWRREALESRVRGARSGRPHRPARLSGVAMRRAVAIFALAGALGCAEDAPDGDRATVLTDLADIVLMPSYDTFRARAVELDAALSACDAPTARERWRATQSAWARTEVYQEGPTRTERIESSVHFWPIREDRIQEVLTATTQAFTPDYVNGLRSTQRGLPVIEYLLFEGELTDRRCDYAAALGGDLVVSATRLTDAWSPEGDDYRATFATDATVDEVVNQMIRLTQIIESNKLSRPTGAASGGVPRPDVEESPFAARAAENVIDDLDGLLAAYTCTHDGRTGASVSGLVADRNPTLDADVKAAIATARASASALETPIARTATTSPESIEAAIADAKTVSRLFTADVAGLLGITVTFSDNDGD